MLVSQGRTEIGDNGHVLDSLARGGTCSALISRTTWGPVSSSAASGGQSTSARGVAGAIRRSGIRRMPAGRSAAGALTLGKSPIGGSGPMSIASSMTASVSSSADARASDY